jgi:hypothetical protein
MNRRQDESTPKDPKDKAEKDSSLGKNPAERPTRRPSEGGVGSRHTTGGFTNPERSPTSKTP